MIGKIRMEEKRKLGEYEHRLADVTFDFNTDEGDSYTEATNSALDCVHAILHKKHMTGSVTFRDYGDSAGPLKSVDTFDSISTKVTPEETVAPLQVPNPVPAPEYKSAPPPLPVRKPRTKKVAEPVAEVEPPAVVKEDVLTAVEPEITDTELSDETIKRAVETHQGMEIRRLVTMFAGPPPARVFDIPQKMRAAYLRKLEALEVLEVE